MDVESFIDIKMVEIDDQRTTRSEKALYDVHIRLSARPLAAWVREFDTAWRVIFYTMKRHAWISGDCLVIRCVPEEFDKYHRSQLESSFTRANNGFRAYLAAQEREQAARIEQENQERARLAAIKEQIKFN